MLQSLDLNENDISVYRFLLSSKGATPEHISAVLNLAPEVVDDALNTLKLLSIVWTSRKDPQRFRVSSPEQGITALVAAHENEILHRSHKIRSAMSLIGALTAEYRESRLGDSEGGVEVLHDTEHTWRRVSELASGAGREGTGKEVAICGGGEQIADVVDLIASWQRDESYQDRTVRCVFPHSVTKNPKRRNYARQLSEWNVRVRTASSVPTQMVVIESTSAVLHDPEELGTGGALVVHARGVVNALSHHFSLLWEAASPLGGTVEEGSDSSVRALTAAEETVLRMLADGLTDEAIARRLDVSIRTVRRMIAKLVQALGSRSRFEAAVLATKRGWV
jgi:DNA-binding CsgD family transcriptional regulator